MNPTTARIVHFFPDPDCVTESGPIQPYAAIVTRVNRDGTLELVTFGENSIYFQHNVPKLEPLAGQGWGWAWPHREGQA